MSTQFKPYELINPYRHKACLTLHKNLTRRIYASVVKTSATGRPFSPSAR